VPSSLGVNPSLTISALSERCAERLVNRSADLGLPARPASLRPRVPPEHVGERVVPSQPPSARPQARRHRHRRRHHAKH
jgi:choline dehydrogenase-like flavoprotein